MVNQNGRNRGQGHVGVFRRTEKVALLFPSNDAQCGVYLVGNCSHDLQDVFIKL